MPRILDHAPIPRRTLTDRRLAASHFRLLGAIAMLSRPSASGLECTATQVRLSEVAGIAPAKVNAIIRKLADLGYLKCSRIPTNRRTLAYSIFYEDTAAVADKTTYQGGGVPLTRNAPDSNPAAKSTPTQIVVDPKSSPPCLESTAYQDAFTAATPDTDTPADQVPDRSDAPLPTDWRLTMDRRVCAEESRERLGLPWVDLDLEADKFVAHNRALSGPAANHSDWNQAWLDWVIAAVPTKPAAPLSPVGNTLPQGQQFKGRLIDPMKAYAEAATKASSNADLEAF